MGNPRRANGHRRTQLRKRVLAHYSVCALCERPVDKTLPYTDPGAPEVDEIIPREHFEAAAKVIGFVMQKRKRR